MAGNGKSPYAKYGKRPHDYSSLWSRFPYLHPRAQGIGARKMEIDVDVDNGRHSVKHKRALREALQITEAY